MIDGYSDKDFFHFQFIQVGILTSIQVNNKEVETARKGDEVCVKIEPTPGEAPKMFGRHFDETDVLMSKVIFTRSLIKLKENRYLP